MIPRYHPRCISPLKCHSSSLNAGPSEQATQSISVDAHLLSSGALRLSVSHQSGFQPVTRSLWGSENRTRSPSSLLFFFSLPILSPIVNPEILPILLHFIPAHFSFLTKFTVLQKNALEDSLQGACVLMGKQFCSCVKILTGLCTAPASRRPHGASR